MAFSHASQMPTEPLCPIRVDVLTLLFRSDEETVRTAAFAIPEEDRCLLAMFCAARPELRNLGLAVAALCDKATLVAVGGTAGAILFAKAQRGSPFGATLPRISGH